jgi:hypothetical protein
VTQHGSFPGRPRGRRARHQADVPEGDGYVATPQDEREFPDLPPIRPRDARPRDPRDPRVQGDWPGAQGDWPGQSAQSRQSSQYGQPDQYGQQGLGGYGGGYPAGGAGYGQSGPSQVNPGYGVAQPQARHAQSAPVQQVPAEQTQPQWNSAPPAKQTKQEEDVPSWAEPDSVEAFSARWHRRGLDSRDERRSGRRSRRRILFAGGGVAAVVVAVAVYLLIGTSNSPANLGLGSLVTRFLPGEVQSVPDACNTVPLATLHEYLPGTTKQAAPPLNSGTNTECSWTLDNAPTYRVLVVRIVAYTPSALVANSSGSGLVPDGNGSATYAAEAAFESFEYSLTTPTPKSEQPVATITDIAGLPGGNDSSAFAATQVFNRDGAITDVATVYVRYRNVIITAAVDGLDRASGSKKYGPVTMSDLTAAAKTVAKQVASQITH